ncbi:hypothetical protein [Nocardiopsis kunsanensis]|nr:hypothetical protein [Nocardiopsis kunsanensis]
MLSDLVVRVTPESCARRARMLGGAGTTRRTSTGEPAGAAATPATDHPRRTS